MGGMIRTLPIIVLAAAALAGCNKQDQTIVAGGPDERGDNAAASSGPVALPPSISASKVYRCDDNSIVYVDWMSDGLSANVRSKVGGPSTRVATDTAGTPMKGANIEVAGNPADRMVVVTRPGKPSVGCNA